MPPPFLLRVSQSVKHIYCVIDSTETSKRFAISLIVLGRGVILPESKSETVAGDMPAFSEKSTLDNPLASIKLLTFLPIRFLSSAIFLFLDFLLF